MKKYYLVFLVRPFSMVPKASENFDSVTTSTVDNVSDAWVARLLGRVPGIWKYFVFIFVSYSNQWFFVRFSYYLYFHLYIWFVNILYWHLYFYLYLGLANILYFYLFDGTHTSDLSRPDISRLSFILRHGVTVTYMWSPLMTECLFHLLWLILSER